jgi:hypothetical protein
MAKLSLNILCVAGLLAYGAASFAAGAPYHAKSLDPYPIFLDKAARVLESRSDPNSLATAAVFRFASAATGTGSADSTQPSALQLIARASDLAPQDAAIGWLHLKLCAAEPPCDTRDVATVLRWVDPDNSAAWMWALSNAQKDKEAVEVNRVLADMARGKRFDLYYNQIVALMFDAMSAARHDLPRGYVDQDFVTLALVRGITSLGTIPPFTQLGEACRESGPATERREDCLKLVKIMQNSDAIMAQLLGFKMESRLIPAESKEAKVLAERRQLLESRLAACDKLDASLLPWTRNSRARERLAQMRLRPREEDVCIALLRDRKMTPPEKQP